MTAFASPAGAAVLLVFGADGRDHDGLDGGEVVEGAAAAGLEGGEVVVGVLVDAGGGRLDGEVVEAEPELDGFLVAKKRKYD